MSKFTKVITIAAMCASLAAAQRMHAWNTTGGTPGAPPDPAMMIQMRVAFLTSVLGLSDSQKTQATSIFTSAQTSAQAIHSSLQTAMQTLSDAVKKNDGATIDQASATLGTLHGQLTAINAKANAAFYAILTADQQTKYDSMPHGGPHGGPGPGPGGPGPMMMPPN